MCDTLLFFFFFQAEDGIRDGRVTGVQTCALPIYPVPARIAAARGIRRRRARDGATEGTSMSRSRPPAKIGRASCRERGEISGGGGCFKKKKRKSEWRGRGRYKGVGHGRAEMQIRE